MLLAFDNERLKNIEKLQMDIVLKAKPSETEENTALYNFFVWTGSNWFQLVPTGSKGNSSPATRMFGGTQNM